MLQNIFSYATDVIHLTFIHTFATITSFVDLTYSVGLSSKNSYDGQRINQDNVPPILV